MIASVLADRAREPANDSSFIKRACDAGTTPVFYDPSDSNCQLAQRSTQRHRGPYAVIGDDVILKEGVEVGSHVVIEGPTIIGNEPGFFLCALNDTAGHRCGERTTLTVGARNTIRNTSPCIDGIWVKVAA